jgi:hypothetical protein
MFNDTTHPTTPRQIARSRNFLPIAPSYARHHNHRSVLWQLFFLEKEILCQLPHPTLPYPISLSAPP